ncbi:MAG: rhombosortase [Gammaproteobacteria bacterium]|nr:MAG: rhombosortase [Gammaproteobacteria bacterium]
MSLTVKKAGETLALLPAAMRPWLGLALLMTVLQLIPDAQSGLRFDRALIEAGQVWRLFTANFIHLGWGHLALNVAGLLVLGWLFAEDFPLGAWGWILVLSSLASSMGIWFWAPDVDRCVGLSGALHGLFAAGCLAWVRAGPDVGIGVGLLLAGAGKLIYEQTAGSMPFSAGIVGGPVVTDAHLWGAVGGLLAVALLRLWRRLRARL